MAVDVAAEGVDADVVVILIVMEKDFRDGATELVDRPISPELTLQDTHQGGTIIEGTASF